MSTPVRSPSFLLAALSVCTLMACGHGGVESGPLVVTRDTVGDTVTVKTASGSVWEKPASLHEDLRIGSLEGEGPETFGDILQVAVAPDGDILVFDGQVPALRRFSSSGRYLGTVGQEGRGPGEYGPRPTGLTVDSQGHIILSDPATLGLSEYSVDGDFLRTLGATSGLSSLFGMKLTADARGRVYRAALMVPAIPGAKIPAPWPIGAEVHDQDGRILDTIPPPQVDGKQAHFFGITPDGSVLAVARGEPVFEVQHEDGSVLRVELPFEPTPYTEDLAKRRVSYRPVAAADGATKVPIPQAKPFYVDDLIGRSGRIWLRRPTQPRSEKEVGAAPLFQPSVLDVFEPDGTYLGVVELPPRTRPVAVIKDHLYVIELGEYDEQYVARYEVRHP